jgi:hypothetical protein
MRIGTIGTKTYNNNRIEKRKRKNRVKNNRDREDKKIIKKDVNGRTISFQMGF